MTNNYYHRFWIIGGVPLCCLVITSPTAAQIVPDATLPVNSTVKTEGNTSTITGGTPAGSNLFHSFKDFSVPTGSTADFNNALNIQNIITRVTGGSVSHIDGLLQTNGTANLFLLNPSGILFGPNAQLNIRGSFLASTASSLKFADGSFFSAINPERDTLLTVSVPVGLQLGGTPGNLRVQGSIAVRPFQTLALVGGDISIEGGQIQAAGGQIELGSVSGQGLVSLNPTTTGWTLGYEGVQNFQDVQLSRGASVDASGTGGGSIQVQARSLRVGDSARIVALTLGALDGGAITVNTTDSVELTGTGTYTSDVLRFATGTVTPDNLPSGLFTISYDSGAAGSVAINTKSFTASNGAIVATSTFKQGQAGNLTINALDTVQLQASALITGTLFGSTANAGNLTINTERLVARDNGIVGTSSLGSGRSGELTVNAKKSVELIGSNPISVPPYNLFTGIFSSTLAGEAGELHVTTERLVLLSGAGIAASTNGSYPGGNITVEATDSVELSGSSPDGLTLSALVATAVPGATGNAGNLTVRTGRLLLEDRGRLSVRSQGTGAAGTINVVADSIRLDNKGSIAAATTIAESGGNITLHTQSLQLSHNSVISASAGTLGGGGDGGNVTINTDTLVASGNSNISANAYQGRGGNIKINTQGLFFDSESKITASSTRGINGIVDINTPLNDIHTVLPPLEGELATPEQVLADSCLARRNSEQSSFTVTGTGGLPPSPYSALSSRYAVTGVRGVGGERGSRGEKNPVVHLRTSAPHPLTPSPSYRWKQGDPIQEAQGIVRTADGRISLGTIPQMVAVKNAENLVCH